MHISSRELNIRPGSEIRHGMLLIHQPQPTPSFQILSHCVGYFLHNYFRPSFTMPKSNFFLWAARSHKLQFWIKPIQVLMTMFPLPCDAHHRHALKIILQVWEKVLLANTLMYTPSPFFLGVSHVAWAIHEFSRGFTPHRPSHLAWCPYVDTKRWRPDRYRPHSSIPVPHFHASDHVSVWLLWCMSHRNQGQRRYTADVNLRLCSISSSAAWAEGA